jgi:outer membrane biosynthesis protein TonB
MERVKIVAAFSPDASEQFYDTIMKARALSPGLKDLVLAMARRLTTRCLVALLLNPAATEDLAGSVRKTLKFGESLGIKQDNLDPMLQRQVDAAQKAAESNASKSKEDTDKKEKTDKTDKKVEKKEKKAEKKEKKAEKEDKKEKKR